MHAVALPAWMVARVMIGAIMSGWKSIAGAPNDQDVQLWVQGRFGARALPYPCRLTADGWINSEFKLRLATSMKPEYWREWQNGPVGSSPQDHCPDPRFD